MEAIQKTRSTTTQLQVSFIVSLLTNLQLNLVTVRLRSDFE